MLRLKLLLVVHNLAGYLHADLKSLYKICISRVINQIHISIPILFDNFPMLAALFKQFLFEPHQRIGKLTILRVVISILAERRERSEINIFYYTHISIPPPAA